MILERTHRAISDFKYALEAFSKKPIAEDFRLTLFLCLCLIRAIGQIVKNEVEEMPTLKLFQQKLYQSKRNDILYTEFIKKFRDEIVKEYGVGVSWASITEYETAKHRMEYRITRGIYEDRDVRELLQEAVDWWENYVNILEDEYKRSSLK